MSIINKILPTTVVGSYPSVRPKGLKALYNPHSGALETAVADQITAGIDIISDGQVGGDMISLVASNLPGIKGQNITGRVQAPPRPFSIAPVKYALSHHPKVKGILTGPSTLACALKIKTPNYRDRSEVTLDIAQALAEEARSLENAGVTLIQIDEPILSTGAADLHTAQQSINLITSVVRVPTCLHVCGDLGTVIDELLKIQVSIFDFEFAANPENRELLSSKDLKGRQIGYGVIDSADPEVDSIPTIKRRIEEAIDTFGADALLIDPDCGLRMHSRDVAYSKLDHMVQATRSCRTEL